jgi:uncharacterized lipoprotein YmbA
MIMRRYVRPVRFLALALPIAFAGCFKLSRESPTLQLYVLAGGTADPMPATTVATPPVGRAAFTVGLRRIELASHLSLPEVVMRRGPNQLVVSQFHRWGGDLAHGINRAVAVHLAASPQVRDVDVAPWTARARHDLLVQLHVTRFEGVADSAASEGHAQVTADWDIIRPFDGRVLIRGSTDDRAGTFRVGDYSGLVAGLDAGLAQVARDIGACLARFPNDSTPPSRCERTSR